MEESTVYTIIIVAGLANLALFFFLIQFAVKAALKPMIEDIAFLREMKVIEMQKQGYGGEVQKVIFTKKELKKLGDQLSGGYITAAQYEERKKQLLAEN